MTTSRTAWLEQRLKGKKCPMCQQTRLIQRTPRVYDQVRCTNCGAVGRIREDISHN